MRFGGQAPAEHQQKIYMAIQIVRRQCRGSALAISSFSPMHCWQSRLASYLPANGPRALKWLPAGCIWKLCCSACRPIAGRARGCISAGRQTSLCFQTCGGCLLMECHTLQRCADIGHAARDQQAFGLTVRLTLHDLEQSRSADLRRCGGHRHM